MLRLRRPAAANRPSHVDLPGGRFLCRGSVPASEAESPGGCRSLDPRNRQRFKDSRLNPTSWRRGNRCSRSGNRWCLRGDTRNARPSGSCPTNRPASHGESSPLRSSMRVHLPEHPCSSRASNPRPTPKRSRVHRAVHTRSQRTNPLVMSAHRPSDSRIHCSSQGCAQLHLPSDNASPSPRASRTPTPTRSATDTARPSPPTATERIAEHRSSSRR